MTMALAWSAVTARSEQLQCDGPSVTVVAPGPVVAHRTCQSAARSLRLLAECGVVLTEPQHIAVRERIPDMADCIGIYHCGENRIEVLSPAAIERLRRADSAFHAIPTLLYFDSVVTHELAHAAHDAVPCPFSDCLVTSEYVAYAMQVYALPPTARELFEQDVPLAEKVSRYDLSTIGLLMAPDRFARDVWAHFSQRADGCAYVADMMQGNFFLDTERP